MLVLSFTRANVLSDMSGAAVPRWYMTTAGEPVENAFVAHGTNVEDSSLPLPKRDEGGGYK